MPDKHRLTDWDPETSRADCTVCGPRVRYRTTGTSIECLGAVKRGNRRRRYGLSDEDHGILLSVQDGLCAICKRPEDPSKPLHVDHCHATGQVRGLLCFSCNSILGNAKDDPEILRAAIDYLVIYGAKPVFV